MMIRWTIAILLVFTFFPALALADDPCEEARKLRLQEDFRMAEVAAHYCINKHPYYIDGWVELSRALAMQGDYDAALGWLKATPVKSERADIVLWKVRLMYWAGAHDEARRTLARLALSQERSEEFFELSRVLKPEPMVTEPQTERVQYTDLIPRVIGAEETGALVEELDYEAMGSDRGPRSELEREPETRSGDEMQLQGGQRFYYAGKMTYIRRPEATFGWQMGHHFGAQVNERLQTELRVEGYRRHYEDDRLHDVLLGGDVSYRLGERFRLSGGASLVPRATFSPRYSAYAQPSMLLAKNLELGVRLWRIQFEDLGVNLVSPQLVLGLGRVELEGRYYFGRESTGRDSHAVFGRALFFATDRLRLHLGGSFGNQAEYMEGRAEAPQRAFSTTTGLQVGVTDSLDLLFDVNYRNERVDQETHHLYHGLGGFRLSF